MVLLFAMLRHTIHITTKKTVFARHLRRNQTNGERALWQKLRAKRCHGLKFRRQVNIGPYVVDFLCIEKMLIIEIDGTTHFDAGAKERDALREEYLRRHGFEILRFSNTAAAESPKWVAHSIASHVGCNMN